MVDIHHHLLWGLDDGAKNFDMSLAMAKAAAADGITEIVCTPHASSQFAFEPELNRQRYTQLQEALDAEGVSLKLGLGCDFHLSYDNIVEVKENPSRFSVNGLGYLMVEVPDYGVPPGLAETFYELQLVGLTPILTHPERNPTLQNDLERVAEWMRGGVLVQVTGDSVTGRMGRVAQRTAHKLLERRWVHFLATDAHNLTSRPPRLSEARDAVAKKYGADYAESLVTINPRCVFEGAAVSPIVEPQDLYNEFKEKSWFGRLMESIRS